MMRKEGARDGDDLKREGEFGSTLAIEREQDEETRESVQRREDEEASRERIKGK